MEADSGGSDSSAEKHALTKMYEKICITFPIEIAHPTLISCYVIDFREKDEIFQNNPSRFNRVSALLNIISRDIQIEDYRRFNNFLIALQKTSNCKFLWQGLQQHLQQHRQRVRTSLSSERVQELQVELFTKNRSYLTQRLNPSDIVDNLITYRLVGSSAGQEISSPYHTNLHRNGLIVNELSQGQPGTVEKFCEILKKSQRTKYIADKLEKGWRELLQSEGNSDQPVYGPSPPKHIGPDMSSSRLGQGVVGPDLRSGQGAGYHVPPAPHSAQASGSSTISTMNMELMQKYVIPNLAEHWSAISDFLEYPLQVKKKFSYGHAKDCVRALLEDWISTDNGRKPKTWPMFLQVLNEFGESEGEPVVNVTRWVVQCLMQEGVLESQRSAPHTGYMYYSPQFPRKVSTDPPQMKQGYLKTDQSYIHRSSEDIQFRGQKEYYQATPHDGGHLSSTTTSDTFPEEEQWQYYQSYVGGRMSSTNTSEVFGEEQIPRGSYNPNVTPQHQLYKVHHRSLPNYNRQSSVDQPVDRRRAASDAPQSTRPMNNYGKRRPNLDEPPRKNMQGHLHVHQETRTIYGDQQLERSLYHDFSEADGHQTNRQHQYSRGPTRGGHQPHSQHSGQYDIQQGHHPQGHYPTMTSTQPHQQGQPHPSLLEEYQGQYGQQPPQGLYGTHHQPGLQSSHRLGGNLQSTDQLSTDQLQSTDQRQLSDQVNTASQRESQGDHASPPLMFESQIMIQQQIQKHQQQIGILKGTQHQLGQGQQFQRIKQEIQLQIDQEEEQIQLLCSQLIQQIRQVPPETQQQPSSKSHQQPHHPCGAQYKQSAAPRQPMNYGQPSVQQGTAYGVQQDATLGQGRRHPDTTHGAQQVRAQQSTTRRVQQGASLGAQTSAMHGVQQGTTQWHAEFEAHQASTITTQSPQGPATRPGQSKSANQTEYVQGIETLPNQFQQSVTIQDHQIARGSSRTMDETYQEHIHPSPLPLHGEHVQVDTTEEELRTFQEKQQQKEEMRKLQEQAANQSSQGKALKAKAEQLTEVGVSQEESQGDSQQGNSIRSPVTCQHDKESQILFYSGQGGDTALDLENNVKSLAITCEPHVDSQDAKYHDDVSSLQHDGPPRGATSSGVSHEDTEKNDGTTPATVAPTNTAALLTSSVAHTPSTTSGEVISESVAGTSDVSPATRPYSMSSVSSTASGSSHVDSEIQGTDQRTTSPSTATSMTSGTATSDRSATHSHSTINVLLVEPSTTAQSGTTDSVTTMSSSSTMTASLSSSASANSRVSQIDRQEPEQSVTIESTPSTTTDTSVLSTTTTATTNMVSTTRHIYSTSSSLSSSATNTMDMGEEIDTDDAPINLTWGDHLGSGSFGKVYHCYCEDTGIEIAAKVIEIHPNSEEKELVSLEKEINMLKDLQHHRIVVYHGTRRSNTNVKIFMEYMPGGSLRSFLKKNGSLNEKLTKKYTRQLLEGVEYLHSQKIVHRDIKGDNVLRDSKGNVKIADFGTCKRVQTIYLSDVKASTTAGTYHWMAPEVFKCEPSTIKSDVWSVGCTVFEMLTVNPPNYELAHFQLIYLVGNDDPMDIQLPPHCSNAVHDFVTSCLRKNASSRPTAEELLCHEFLNSSLPHGASAAPKLVATAKPSTEQPVAGHTTVTTMYGSAIQQPTPDDVDATDQALSATNTASTKGTSTASTIAERNIANNQSLTKHPVLCTSVTAENAKKWSAAHHPSSESSSDHQVTTDQSPSTTGTDISEDYTDSDNIMDNKSGGKKLPKTVASPSNADKPRRPSLQLKMYKRSDSKTAMVEMVSDVPSTPVSEDTPVVKKIYIMNNPHFHVTQNEGCQLISMTNAGQQFPIDFHPKGVNFNSLQPYTEDIINGVNVNTITPPMLAHGLLTPEHGEYFFNPHVISTEKQRKLGFLIITLSEECAQIFLQCLKNTRDYAPHDDLLKKIEDGLKSGEK
ncbi:uncharacterized protein [Dysidea avara]|uniref:uncharacterized protein isoform X3 n=1 Tax=Dysidea avara TaxID=196820 RepID=UPI003326AB15